MSRHRLAAVGRTLTAIETALAALFAQEAAAQGGQTVICTLAFGLKTRI